MASKVYAGCVKPLPREDLEHILRHTRSLWENARGRRIFISGGTGFMGTWMLESLAFCNRELNIGITATALSRDPEAFARRMPHLASEPSIQLIQGDVRTFAFPEQEYSYVIHAATSTSALAASQPGELLSTQVGGTQRMLTFAKSRHASSFLFTSSGAVYGRQPESLSHIPEDYLLGRNSLEPTSAYAEGKRASERMCSIGVKESNIHFTIARCFAFIGPHLPLDQHFAIGNFIGDVIAGRNIAIRGDGTPMRSYLYAADLAVWLWTMLLRDPGGLPNPSVFNVGSGEAISILDLARTVIEELAPSLQIEIAQKPCDGMALEQYVPDVHIAESRLGLRPMIDLREAIRRTAAWHR